MTINVDVWKKLGPIQAFGVVEDGEEMMAQKLAVMAVFPPFVMHSPFCSREHCSLHIDVSAFVNDGVLLEPQRCRVARIGIC